MCLAWLCWVNFACHQKPSLPPASFGQSASWLWLLQSNPAFLTKFSLIVWQCCRTPVKSAPELVVQRLQLLGMIVRRRFSMLLPNWRPVSMPALVMQQLSVRDVHLTLSQSHDLESLSYSRIEVASLWKTSYLQCWACSSLHSCQGELQAWAQVALQLDSWTGLSSRYLLELSMGWSQSRLSHSPQTWVWESSYWVLQAGSSPRNWVSLGLNWVQFEFVILKLTILLNTLLSSSVAHLLWWSILLLAPCTSVLDVWWVLGHDPDWWLLNSWSLELEFTMGMVYKGELDGLTIGLDEADAVCCCLWSPAMSMMLFILDWWWFQAAVEVLPTVEVL